MFPLNYVVEGDLVPADLGESRSIAPLSPRSSMTSMASDASPAAIASTLTEVPFAELQMQGRIGRGGFGTVFRARFRGVDVAVKQIDTSMMSPKEIVKKAQELKCVSARHQCPVTCRQG